MLMTTSESNLAVIQLVKKKKKPSPQDLTVSLLGESRATLTEMHTDYALKCLLEQQFEMTKIGNNLMFTKEKDTYTVYSQSEKQYSSYM